MIELSNITWSNIFQSKSILQLAPLFCLLGALKSVKSVLLIVDRILQRAVSIRIATTLKISVVNLLTLVIEMN